ncbi:MAG TPA: hypothetical protein IAD03_05860 [Candidatus Caccousia stercoris]|uniref:Uncharacterized protein n=1 Tax=Candidatus Caccousia stercoris TaxID=2840723 RepID=A0A9D1K1X3_9FIRM|nr:hypothetical protein [Candidatus Caccousia stercoris]
MLISKGAIIGNEIIPPSVSHNCPLRSALQNLDKPSGRAGRGGRQLPVLALPHGLIRDACDLAAGPRSIQMRRRS